MTMMNDLSWGEIASVLALPLLVGIGLGIFFFGGLWWTVQRIPSSPHPTRLALSSFAIRGLVSVTVFFWIMDGSWERLLACGVGFILARMVMVRRLRPAG